MSEIGVRHRMNRAEARVAELGAVLTKVVQYEHGMPHRHRVPGRWDGTGALCERCADFAHARALGEKT